MIPGVMGSARQAQPIEVTASDFALGAPTLGTPDLALVSAGPALTLVIVYDVSTRSMTTNAGISAADLNGNGISGTALDAALQATVTLATALVGAGRGDQVIILQPSGWSGVRATTSVTAAAIEAARVAGNLPSTVFSTIGTAADQPLFYTNPGNGQTFRGDTIDTTAALVGARDTIAANPAAARKILFCCATDGRSSAIAGVPSANRPAGSIQIGASWYKSDPTSVLSGLAADGVDIDVCYFEAGASLSVSAILAAIDSDGTIHVTNIAPIPDFASFLP